MRPPGYDRPEAKPDKACGTAQAFARSDPGAWPQAMQTSGHSLPAAAPVLPPGEALLDTITSFLFSVKLGT